VYIFKAAAMAYCRNMPKEKDAKFLISQELALSATVVWPEADLLDGRAMPALSSHAAEQRVSGHGFRD
jgi:hypothetical protein